MLGDRLDGVLETHFKLLAFVVVTVATINLFGRLGLETVTEWDESLYATSAAEMLQSGQWTATTFDGQLDYYNSKPPLNVWLIAISFKLFGINLWSLRLVSAFAGLATVTLLMFWLRHAYSAALALTAGLVLSTCFGFFYVHSSRTGNPDALFTLLALGVVVTSYFAAKRPSLVIALGPLLAGAFLLKGFGAALHGLLALVCLAVWLRRVITPKLAAITIAAAIIPVGVWACARWYIDELTFFRYMVEQDFVGVAFERLDGHRGSTFFYLDVLQKYQYDWIIATAAAFALYLPSWVQAGSWARAEGWDAPSRLLAGATATLLLVPTMMQTKVSWYGNPLLPFFSIAIGAIIVRALRLSAPGIRQTTLLAVIITAVVTAESRLVWHSYHRRDLASSDQGLLLAHANDLAGQRVFRANWTRADTFVAKYLIGCEHIKASSDAEFLAQAQPGDFFLQRRSRATLPQEPAFSNGRYFLYRR